MFHPTFTDRLEVTDYRTFLQTDADKRNHFHARLQSAGVRVTARGTWFLSAAHTDEDIERTLEAAERAFSETPARGVRSGRYDWG